MGGAAFALSDFQATTASQRLTDRVCLVLAVAVCVFLCFLSFSVLFVPPSPPPTWDRGTTTRVHQRLQEVVH